MDIVELKNINPLLYTTDKFGCNSKYDYSEFYKNLLNPRQSETLNLLEIGIETGGSLALFHDFLSNSTVHGIDTDLSKIKINVSDFKRMKTFNFDAYDKNNWNLLPIKYDIIIDDGSHIYENQIFFLNNFLELLNDNGILVLEDISSDNLDLLVYEMNCDRSKTIIYNTSRKTNINDSIIITSLK